MSAFSKIFIFALSFNFLIGCASSQMKARKEQRDKIAQSSKLYCEFINGDTYPDIDIALNIEMSKHCDGNKAPALTSYRSPSEAVGIVYCCSMKEKEDTKKSEAAKTSAKANDLKLDDEELAPSLPKADTKPELKQENKTPENKNTPKKDEKK